MAARLAFSLALLSAVDLSARAGDAPILTPAAAPIAGKTTAPEERPRIEVFLVDGSRIIGTLVTMTGGKLKVTTAFAKEIEVAWDQVAAIVTDRPAAFVLEDGSTIRGQAARTPEGGMQLRSAGFADPLPVTREQITDINPPIKPAMTFKGFVAASAMVNDGNTHNRAASISGEFEARSEIQRFDVRGIYNYADDNDHELSARNWRGNLEYDFFVTRRLYLFAAALFENDRFQDLRLRTALSAGPGYQIIDRGTFEAEWLKELEVRGAAGLAYFNESYYDGEDRSYLAARWMLKVLWPIVPGKIVLFHDHEGFPSLEDSKNLVVLTEQGVRFSILKNLFAALQLNWRWTSNPSDGLNRADTTFLLSIGYNFDFTG